MWGYGLDRAGSGQVQVEGTCECGNEPSGSIKYGEFLDQLKTGQLLKKDCAPWNEYKRMPAVTRRKLLAVATWKIRKTVGQQSQQLSNILEGNQETLNFTVQSRFVTEFNEATVVFAESDLRLLIPERNGFVSQWDRPNTETALVLYLCTIKQY